MFPPPRIKMKASYGLGSDGKVSHFVWIAPIADYSNGGWLYMRGYGRADQPEGAIEEAWAKPDDTAFCERLRSWLAEPLTAFDAFAARVLPRLCAAEPDLNDAYLDLEVSARLNVLPYRGSGPPQYGEPLYIAVDRELKVWLPDVEEALRWSSSGGELTNVHLELRSLEDLWPSLMWPLGELARDRTDDVESLFEGWATPAS